MASLVCMGALSVRARDSVNSTQRVLALAIAKMDASLDKMRYPSWLLADERLQDG